MAQPAMSYRYCCEDSMAHAASGHGLMGIQHSTTLAALRIQLAKFAA